MRPRNRTTPVNNVWRNQVTRPLPPPEVLQQYDQILPGFTERFLQLAEGEAAHRRKMESWLVIGRVLQPYAGMLCGLIIGIFGLYVAWQLGAQGHTWVAGIIAALDLTSLVRLFTPHESQMNTLRQIQAQDQPFEVAVDPEAILGPESGKTNR